jgi:hypothetical protein
MFRLGGDLLGVMQGQATPAEHVHDLAATANSKNRFSRGLGMFHDLIVDPIPILIRVVVGWRSHTIEIRMNISHGSDKNKTLAKFRQGQNVLGHGNDEGNPTGFLH